MNTMPPSTVCRSCKSTEVHEEEGLGLVCHGCGYILEACQVFTEEGFQDSAGVFVSAHDDGSRQLYFAGGVHSRIQGARRDRQQLEVSTRMNNERINK